MSDDTPLGEFSARVAVSPFQATLKLYVGTDGRRWYSWVLANEHGNMSRWGWFPRDSPDQRAWAEDLCTIIEVFGDHDPDSVQFVGDLAVAEDCPESLRGHPGWVVTTPSPAAPAPPQPSPAPPDPGAAAPA